MMQYDPLYGYYDDEEGTINPEGAEYYGGPLAPPAGTPGLAYDPTQPAFTPEGGSSIPPPIDTATGTYPTGWEQRDDSLWYFAPQQTAQPSAPAPTGGAPTGGYESGGFEWPTFNAPRFQHKEFSAPTLDDAYGEPGYEFARKEGIRAAENSASGRGVLRSGGTLKDLIGWGNKFAEQNYANVYNRARSTFDTNFGASRDTYDRNYRAAYDEFQPQQRAAELTFDDLYRRWRGELDSTLGVAGMGQG